jgi:hypothetical protein
MLHNPYCSPSTSRATKKSEANNILSARLSNAHLKVDGSANLPGILREARDRVSSGFGIDRSTFQLEMADMVAPGAMKSML